MARVTIEELASRLGLSSASVSYALNGQPGVSDATRERVLALAGELGWQAHASARSLSRSRADAVGLVLTRRAEAIGEEPYYMSLLAGIEAGLAAGGTSLMLRFVTAGEGSDLDVYRRWYAEHRVDGVLLFDLRVNDPRPEQLERIGLPFLVHGGRRADEGWQFDQGAEAAVLVAHLSELGHRRITHVTGPLTLLHERERHRAVRAECAARGIEIDWVEADYSFEAAVEVTTEALRTGSPPSALVYSNDLMAVGGLRALRDAGQEHHIAVTSWDDSVLCQTATPAITALQRRTYDAGRRSATLLLSALDARWNDPEQVAPSTLVVRESTSSIA